MKHLDLFSGIGGFSLAAKWAGIDTIQFVEKDKFCQKVLAKNFPHVPIHENIKDFHTSRHADILTAGFPCQPFSIAGKQRGIKDDRYLWPEVIRIVSLSRPTWVILENVPGIISHLDPILEDLEKENYNWQAFVIPASAVGAPHKRERVWIIAHANCLRCHYGIDHGKERCLQKNIDWYLEEIQPKWQQRIPNAWKVMQSGDWLEFNADLMRKNDGLSDRVDRIRSLGNAIVPQIPYLFMKMIQEIERT